MFEAAIAANPDDESAYLVYADWLQSRGDPRGDLIVLHHRGMMWEADKLLRLHADRLDPLPSRPELVTLEWRLGFVRSCRFSLDHRDRDPPSQPIETALDQLLSHPSMCFVRHLRLGLMGHPRNEYRDAIAVLGRHDLRTLDALALGHGFHCGARVRSTTIGATAPIYGAAPNLTKLELDVPGPSAAETLLDGIRLPRLRSLRVQACSNRQSLLALLGETWPELHTLDLLGAFQIADDSEWKPLLSGRAFPRLEQLSFGAYGTLAGRCGALFSGAAIVRRLDTLDLSRTVLVDDDLRAMVRHRDTFANLKRLDLGAPQIRDPRLRADTLALCSHVVIRPA